MGINHRTESVEPGCAGARQDDGSILHDAGTCPVHEGTYAVQLTALGFQIRDSRTEEVGGDIWASRYRCQQACASMNEGKPLSKAEKPDRRIIT